MFLKLVGCKAAGVKRCSFTFINSETRTKKINVRKYEAVKKNLLDLRAEH